MKKIILNIRGTHCSGKTTAVRAFVENHKSEIVSVMVNGYKTNITVLDGGKYVVLGRYDQSACGGCDRYKGGNHVKSALVYVANTYNPEYIIYEGIIYSSTFKQATEIARLTEELGYKWKSLYLFREYTNCIELLNKRNNGKQVNMDLFNGKYISIDRVYQKLKENNYDVVRIDVTDTSLDFLKGIIDNEVNRR